MIVKEAEYKLIFDGEDVWNLRRMAMFTEEMTLLWHNFPESIKNKYKQDQETLDEIRGVAIRISNAIPNERII